VMENLTESAAEGPVRVELTVWIWNGGMENIWNKPKHLGLAQK